MKKTFCLLLALLLLAGFASCAREEPSAETATGGADAVLPPVRMTEKTSVADPAQLYTFASGYEASDVVATVRIGDWLGEREFPYCETFFRAEVLKTYKGDVPGEIVLRQDGSADATVKQYPLFTAGNELLLFLKQGTEADFGYDEAGYWILGSFTTTFDVLEDGGVRYIADRYGIAKCAEGVRNYAAEETLSADLFASAVASDPIVSEAGYTFRNIYAETEIADLFADLADGNA